MPSRQMDLLRSCLLLICVVAPCLGSLDGWSDWTNATRCSRSCGGGVQQQDRSCLKEGQRRAGECQGSTTQYISCNNQPCPRGDKDFRLEQCRAYNGVPLFDRTIKNSTWDPVYDLTNPCALICTAQNGETRKFSDEVIDGTECDTARDLGICVRGTCQRVGCDRVLGSGRSEDKCLVCGGTGSDCYTVSRSTQRRRIPQNVASEIVVLPYGAKSIGFKVSGIDGTSVGRLRLVILNGRGESYELTQFSNTFGSRKMADIGGTLFTYEQTINTLTYFARGPLAEPLQLKVRYVGEQPLIEYEYSMSRVRRPQSDQVGRYTWTTGRWTTCSAECGEGYQRRQVACRDRQTGRIVRNDLCEREALPAQQQRCNLKACQDTRRAAYRWVPDSWSECDVACGVGSQKLIQRCEETTGDRDPAPVDNSLCSRYVGRMPESRRACTGDECPYWTAGNWGQCSVTCGIGRQRRRLYCQKTPRDESKDVVQVSHDQCAQDKRPEETRECRQRACRETRLVGATSRPVCERYRYGCCPDGRTIARGPDNLGCPGWNREGL